MHRENNKISSMDKTRSSSLHRCCLLSLKAAKAEVLNVRVLFDTVAASLTTQSTLLNKGKFTSKQNSRFPLGCGDIRYLLLKIHNDSPSSAASTE